MSLARTALRLAAIDALNADPLIATMCQGRIFDSRIDELDATEPVPLIVVYTEDDGGVAWSKNNGGPPFNQICDLQLEIALRGTEQAAGGDDISLTLPETDREIDASLDLIESAAVTAVTVGDTAPARLLRNVVTRRVTQVRSIRFTSAESGAKMAMRVVTLTTELKGDEPHLFNPPTGPFASLPEPLRSIAEAQVPGSSGFAVCAVLAGQLMAPVAQPFAGIDLTVQVSTGFDPANPPAASDPAAADPILASIDPP